MNGKTLDPRIPGKRQRSRGIRRFFSLGRRRDRHDALNQVIAPSRSRRVIVWDGRLAAFRPVDPTDDRDPLHESARLIFQVQASLARLVRQLCPRNGSPKYDLNATNDSLRGSSKLPTSHRDE